MRGGGRVVGLLLGVAAALAPAGAWGQTASSRTADSLAVLEASRAFSRAYVAGDTAAVGELYAEDAVLYPPGAEIRGRAAIRRYFAPVSGRENLTHAMVPERLGFDGNTAVDVGTWENTTRRGGGEPQSATGRYLVVWRKGGDGRWRIEYDMWHRSAPRPGG